MALDKGDLIMSHWAEIDENNVVLRVLVGDNSMPNEGHDWFVENLGGTWVKTSYNTRGGVYYDPETNEPAADQSKAFRKNYAGIDFTYDADLDAFIPPKPFNSWVLDEESATWNPPVAMPEDGQAYTWNEETTSWDVITPEASE